jgi:tetratricopeptide (TPR) repeat protein
MSTPRTPLLIFALAAGCAAPKPRARPEMPEAPLFDDLGAHERAVATGSAEAQRYFDQGLRLLYAFNQEEAERSFRRCTFLDPECAACYWGVAMSLGPSINVPRLPERERALLPWLGRAKGLAKSARPADGALIEALARRHSDPPPADAAAQKALDVAYAEAMRAAHKSFPDDDDVATLFAEAMMMLSPWDYWTSDGKPKAGTDELVGTLETVLGRNPRHPGATHYYIHAVEASATPGKALDAAATMGSMMPGAGHLVHMPSHIYMRTGRYAEASEWNRRAIEADKRYLEKAGETHIYRMYVVHNFHFLWASTMMEGRSQEAILAGRGGVARAHLEMLKAMPGFDYVLTAPVVGMVRFGLWDDVLAEPVPAGEFAYATAMWHWARGLAFAAKGQAAQAQAELDAVKAAEEAMPPEAMQSFNSARALLGIASRVLEADLLASKKSFGDAIRLLEEAVKAEDGLRYDEPPNWPIPVRHWLGAVLLQAGRAPAAEAAYRADLERNPENGWALAGLRNALRARKNKAAAVEVEARLKKAWAAADVKIEGSKR